MALTDKGQDGGHWDRLHTFLLLDSFLAQKDYLHRQRGKEVTTLVIIEGLCLHIMMIEHHLQIDGGTGESQTIGSAFHKSVRCAISMKNFGLKTGDVMVLMAPTHLDLAIPFYAAFYLGIAVAPVNPLLEILELQHYFNLVRPSIVFCQSECGSKIKSALNYLGIDAQIVTFDKNEDYCNFQEFMDKYGDESAVEQFRPAEFNTDETMVFLMPTSGTTGYPKAAAVTHKNFAISILTSWNIGHKFPHPFGLFMLCSPLDWFMGILNYYSAPVFKYTVLQTSKPLTPEHACYLINTYKPMIVMLGPAMLTALIRLKGGSNCDFSSFKIIHIVGSKFSPSLIENMKTLSPTTQVINSYGLTEVLSRALDAYSSPLKSCGKPRPHVLCRLVDTETQKNIIEPNKPGELWLKGPGNIIKYYNDPESTKSAFTEDGWFKTGDIMYLDENLNFYYSERMKSLLKYKNYHISPLEIESIIQEHPGVSQVAVTSIKDPECDDLLVACVVRTPGSDVTAKQIKDLINESLATFKQLRGGVVFMKELPMTPSGKVNKKKLAELVPTLYRE